MERPLTLKRQKVATAKTPASHNPIAKVLVDTGLSHLDAPYDYLVLADQDVAAQPGVRVRIRFAGKLVDGWLIDRVAISEFTGKLSPLASVVSSERLLFPQILALCNEVALRQAGTTWDVLRSAIPKRHAKTEELISQPSSRKWESHELPSGYPLLKDFFNHLDAHPRGIWNVAPGRNPYEEIAALIQQVASTNKGVLAVVPDERDLTRLASSIGDGEGVAVLRGDLSPAERYRRYLRVSRGADRVVIGTRAASFAPVHDLGLLVIWDDGDQSHFDPHAPYWNSLDILALRSHLERIPMIAAGFATSVDAARLIDTGWAKLIDHSIRPRVVTADEEVARVSTKTWKLIKDSLAKGPVLISVARTGYRPVLQCRKCSSVAMCACGGRISQDQGRSPQCQICGALHEQYQCPACGGSGYRTPTIGIERTVEEIGRAFPKVPIKHSTGARPINAVPDKSMIVVSTQGVEPIAASGYAAVIILDVYASLLRADLRAEEEARRRWFNTAALVRVDGVIAIAGDGSHPTVQSLIRWSPASAAARELAQRNDLHFPPAWQLATVDTPTADAELVDALQAMGEVLGPITTDDGWRIVVRSQQPISVPLRQLAVARAIKRAPVRVQINPYTL